MVAPPIGSLRGRGRSRSRSISPGRRPPGRVPNHYTLRAWGDESVDLVLSTLEKYRQHYWSRATPSNPRNTVKDNVRSVLETLLPLIPLGYDFHTLTLTVPPRTKQPVEDKLRDGLERLRQRKLFRDASGYVFRHLGRKSGRPHLHLILATPGRLDHEEVKRVAKRIVGGYSQCVYVRQERVAGRRRLWRELDDDDKREALEGLVLYLTRGYLGRLGQRPMPWKHRVTRFGGGSLPRDLPPPPAPFPLLACRRRGIRIFAP